MIETESQMTKQLFYKFYPCFDLNQTNVVFFILKMKKETVFLD